jgi:N-acetylneuraminic acid mutarotase
MKKAILFLLFFVSCSAISGQASWIARPNYPGIARNDAVSFAIATKGYVGTGSTTNNGYRRDFWEWDQATNTWTQIADFGGTARAFATAFATDGRGYVGLGQDTARRQDIWEYDPLTNTWTQKGDFPGGPRSQAVGFASESPKAGFIVTGGNVSGDLNDLWQYDPQADTWSQRTSMPAAGRSGATGFFLSGKGYVGTGATLPSGLLSDFWEWDMQTDIWTQHTSLPTAGRTAAVSFAMNGKGYIATGNNSGPGGANDFWEWDPATDTWTQLANVSTVLREEATGFAIGNSGYVCGGFCGPTSQRLYDFWEYSGTIGIEEQLVFSISLFPVPATDQLTLTFPSDFTKATLSITDLHGNCLYKEELCENGTEKINISSFAQGIYILEVRSEKGTVREKFMKRGD